MRIAVLCTDQGVRVPGDKGAALHLLAISRAFARLGHEVLLVGVAGHGPPPADLRTRLLPHPGRAEGLVREHNKLALTDRFVEEVADELDAFAPDVIYERLSLFGTAGLRLAGRTGAQHVLEVNALVAREEATWRGLHLDLEARYREAVVVAGADAVVTVSKEWEAEVRTLRDGPVATVPNGVDGAAFTGPVDVDGVRRRLGIGVDEQMVVFTGTLRPWHGVDTAVEALDLMPPGTRLVIVGTGPEQAALEARAERLGVSDRLVVTGWLPHDEVARILRSADVGVAPYPDLPDFAFSPLKVFEYLAAGLPYVASDLGQLGDLTTTYGSGTLVPPGSAARLAAAVSAVLVGGDHRRRAAIARVLALIECSWEARAEQILRVVAPYAGARR